MYDCTATVEKTSEKDAINGGLKSSKSRLNKARQVLRMEADSEIAFKLQMEEALTVSLLDDVVPSPNTTDVTYDAAFGAALSNVLQRDNLYKYEAEILDQYKTEVEAKRLRLDLHRQVHDRAFACEISTVPEADWRKNGDNLIRPYGEGSSSSNGQNLRFRVYVKGLVQGMVGGIGVAIRDGNDTLVFELRKGLSDKETRVNEEMVELKALIEALEAAVMLDLKGVTILTDNPLLYQYVSDHYDFHNLMSIFCFIGFP